jgi:preprotein translocase SecF subunit
MNALQAVNRIQFDFVGRRWLWFSISGATILLGFVFLLMHGLNLGLDYTGGGEVYFTTAQGLTLPAIGTDERARLGKDMSEAASKAIGTEVQVRLYEADRIGVQFQATEDELLNERTQKIHDALGVEFASAVGELRGQDPDTPDKFDTRFVGPKIGRELRANGFKALIVGSMFILGYLWWRFEFHFGVAAVIALLHDAFVMVGVFAIGHWQIDLAFIAAVLTVIGYSVNDTVVIFDRIRENVGTRRRVIDYPKVVNDSLCQTLARSINTVVTVIIVLLFLFFMGGDSIHTFALALLVGITSGAYSSIFNAAQVVVQWREMDDRRAGKIPLRQQAIRPQRMAVVGDSDISDDESEAESEFDVVGLDSDDTTKARAQAAKRLKAGPPRKSRKRY